MSLASVFRLILLAAIWGASFLFMRIGVPVLGPSLLIFLRVGLAAVFLLIAASYFRKSLDARQHWRHFLILGFFNTALPFLLFAVAARTVSASLLSILNATAPMWAAVLGAARTRTGLATRSAIGLMLGLAGVAVLVGVEFLNLPAGGAAAVLSGLGAAFSYGIATTYARTAKAMEPFANAHGSMWAATLLLAPLALFSPQPAIMPTPVVIGSVLALGVLCSGIAYLLYFRLISDIGPVSALTVTYLIPVFGILWGVVFLDEAVGWHTLAGGAMVLAGTALVTGLCLRTVFSQAGSSSA